MKRKYRLDLMESDYILKYKDENVVRFNPSREEATIIQPNLLPLNIINYSEVYDNPYEKIMKFFNDRPMLFNRKYCKELLIMCGIDDQNPLNIGLLTNALSYIDNYWVCIASHDIKWKDINLFHNDFQLDISSVGLTGEIVEKTKSLYTGELSLKGTRAKGVFKEDGLLFLYKNESFNEICAEIISSLVARYLNINSSEYVYKKKLGQDCSCCRLFTDTGKELISCRDILAYFNETKISIDSRTYQYFMRIDRENFVMMQLFDYITFNGDRNRDNFGLYRENGVIKGLYPLFDHDSCFKVKKANAIYFVTAASFDATIEYLKSCITQTIRYKLENAQQIFQTQDFKELFLSIDENIEHYEGILHRIGKLLQ